jgi:hypothetical protein
MEVTMSSAKLVIEGSWDEIEAYVKLIKHLGSWADKMGNTKSTTKTVGVATTSKEVEATTAQFADSVPTSEKTIASSDSPKTPIAGGLTFDDIKVLIPQIIATAGREATVKLLAEFHAKKGGDLIPAEYGRFAEAAKKLMETKAK